MKHGAIAVVMLALLLCGSDLAWARGGRGRGHHHARGTHVHVAPAPHVAGPLIGSHPYSYDRWRCWRWDGNRWVPNPECSAREAEQLRPTDY